MTIKDCIDLVDNLKPNQYTIKEKVMWLSFIEAIIINEVLKTHEGYDGRYDGFEGYSEDKLSARLIVDAPYDRLYTAYLKMKIDEENGETARYNNSAALYNTYMSEFKKYYNKTHMPLDVTKKIRSMANKAPMGNGLSDAEIENVVKELTYIITEQIDSAVAENRIYDVVMKYMQNNTELFKGKNGKPGRDGYTPVKGKDYFTPDEKEEFLKDIKERTEASIEKMISTLNKSKVKTTTISLKASAWVVDGYGCYQVVDVPDVTEHSMVDLQPTAEQLAIFHEKDVSFVTENEDGIITVYCIGIKPSNDYVMQATITEVEA